VGKWWEPFPQEWDFFFGGAGKKGGYSGVGGRYRRARAWCQTERITTVVRPLAGDWRNS
jgi:hypothetical protein